MATKADRFAEVVALLSNVDKGKAKVALVLVEPFSYSLFLELTAIVAFGYGFGHRRSHRPVANDNGCTPKAEPERSGTGPETVKPKVEPAVEPAVEPEAIDQWVIAFRERYGRNPQIPEIQARFHGLSKTTAWRRCRAGLEPMVKPSGTRIGKAKPKVAPVVELRSRRRLGRGFTYRQGCPR